MKINSSIFDPLRPDRGSSSDKVNADRTGDAAKSSGTPSSSAKGRDTVQISDTARNLAARADNDRSGKIDPQRVSELRRKVYEGAYNSLDVVDQVARRILTRGDL
ncbi:MAG: flagellar biosynthesis anti-sigma factor FlgM [Gemmatimonadaceae bacterium]